MHTTEIDGILFHHNGDYDGDVIIHVRPAGVEIEVPFSALKNFVANYVRHTAIQAIEDADADSILKR